MKTAWTIVVQKQNFTFLNPIMMINPCKDCTDRHIGCHSECDKYKYWKARLEEVKKAKEEQHKKDEAYFSYKKGIRNGYTGEPHIRWFN